MGIMFDVDAIMEDKSLNTLTWEIIEERGLACGDLMELFDVAVSMGESCASCHFRAEFWAEQVRPDDDHAIIILEVAETFALMSKFMAREAREVVKFLKLRGFIFPEGTTGTRPDDAIGF